MTEWYPGIECEHGYDACPICDATSKTADVELRPVDQTVLGTGNPRANCFQACLAMVLNMPIEECLDITAPEVGDYWVEPLEQWALGLGYAMHSGIKAPSGIPYIANGPTHKRESIHGVVCIDGTMFHDPHPSRDGIESVNYYLWFTKNQPKVATIDWTGILDDLGVEATVDAAKQWGIDERVSAIADASVDKIGSPEWFACQCAARLGIAEGVKIAAQQQWLPISTAPQNGMTFATLIPANKNHPIIHGLAYYCSELGDFVAHGCGFNYVTHWAPIPGDDAFTIPQDQQQSSYGSNDMGYGFAQIDDATYEPAEKE